MESPTVAAITLHPAGGGVAAVARLLWDVVRQQWGSRARLLTIGNGHPTFVGKSQYALRLGALQATGATDWILFSHLGLAKPLGSIPRTWHKRYAVFLHGIEVWRALTVAERRILSQAELRLSNSAYTAARVMEMHPDIGDVVPCPLALPMVNDDQSAGRQHATAVEGGVHDVLVVGRLLRTERYKGHDELIEAWPKVMSAVPDARLVIVGEGDDLPRLRTKAADSAARGSIVFTGFVSAPVLTALYRHAALFALPSRGEGFGLVYLEAMAHKLACVGSTHDAAREIIVDGQTGRLVDQGDSGALADTIADLLVDDRRRIDMGIAGFERAVSEFSFDRFSNRLCGLLGASSTIPAVAIH
jgi:phosphatidylinositol alpha-1,6-mannosyltransferase